MMPYVNALTFKFTGDADGQDAPTGAQIAQTWLGVGVLAMLVFGRG